MRLPIAIFLSFLLCFTRATRTRSSSRGFPPLASPQVARQARQNVGVCRETNIEYNGQTHSQTAARTADDCQKKCDSTKCKHWTWKTGQCYVKRLANPGNKIAILGAVSGRKTGDECSQDPARGFSCHYVETRDPMLCVFPFIGNNIVKGKSSGGVNHDCLASSVGKAWCATEVKQDNQLVKTSDTGKTISCGREKNAHGLTLCSAGGGGAVVGGGGTCTRETSELTSVKKKIADLEKENVELKKRLGVSSLKNSSSGQCPRNGGWAEWGTWGSCSGSKQTRNRSCDKPAPSNGGCSCEGKAIETKACASPAKQSSQGNSQSSCVGRCGKPAGIGSCQCAKECFSFGDCCSDYATSCSVLNPNSCSGRCGATFDRSNPCQCNVGCEKFKNCCSDHAQFCPRTSNKAPAPKLPVSTGPVTDTELSRFTEQLLQMDENNAMRLLTLDTGCKTRVGRPSDCSSRDLFQSIDSSILRKPVYQKLIAMYDNYDNDVLVVEDNTRAEQREEEDFLGEILKTKVMKNTYDFLKQRNLFKGSISQFKTYLKELWFTIYSRGQRTLGSSGFEHVFLGEKKNGKVSGFHSWVYFQYLEKSNKVNYLGHWENVDIGGRGKGLSFTFKWGQEQKPFASMLVGTSPELELAIYTTCLLARGEERCHITLGGQDIYLTTHVFDRRGKKHIASTYMDWKP